LEWATLYGGTSADGGLAIATDSYQNVYFGGYSSSTTNVATTTGLQSVYGGGVTDAFLAKFNSYGGLLWATYYGGTGDEYLTGICTDSAGNIFGCGYTSSHSGIASPGAFQPAIAGTANGDYDAFMVEFNPAGKRQWGTYFGGEAADHAEDIEINGDN